jgi:hypothetical protein
MDVVKGGKFVKGQSGNPAGRPKGSKNAITLLKQSLELQLREQAAPDLGAVLDKAVELALDGNPAMIKMLLEMHMSKGLNDESNATEKVAIQINSAPMHKVEVIDITSETTTEE